MINAPHPNANLNETDNASMFSSSTGRKESAPGDRRYVTMTTIDHDDAGGSEGCGKATALHGADWLALAAAPTFAIIAVLLWSGRLPSLLDGMVSMYLLMSAFNVAPWLKVTASLRSRIRGSRSGIARSSVQRTFLARKQHGRHE
jgi:hypothetical protein